MTTNLELTAIQSPGKNQRQLNRFPQLIYALSLVISISLWFLAIRAPLWIDETGSYWQISGGFSQLWARQSLSFVAYPGILWLWTRLFGVSEVALRVPSVLAMLSATGMLYLAARELFDREIALLAVLIFTLNPLVQFEAIDIRPYAFAVFATNIAILLVLRLRRDDSTLLAALLGFSAALVVWFHFIFAVLLPTLVLCLFLGRRGQLRIACRQLAIALSVFAVAMLPTIAGLRYLFHTSGAHVFEKSPRIADLLWTLAPGWIFPLAFAAVLLSLIRPRSGTPLDPSRPSPAMQALLCLLLAFVPLLTLYIVSVATPIRIFIPRHRLVAVPGIALCWALLLRLATLKPARLFFCIGFVALTAWQYGSPSYATKHNDSWKYALAVAQQNASADNAPLVICSGFIEADFAPMPREPRTSDLFAQLSYYPVSVPVVPLPLSLNSRAMQLGSQFLATAASHRERFLALAYQDSWATLDWLSRQAAPSFTVRTLGVYDYVKVLEFDPRP